MNNKAAFYMSQIDSALIGWNIALVVFLLSAIAMAAGLQALGWYNASIGWVVFALAIIASLATGFWSGLKAFRLLKVRPIWLLSVILVFGLVLSWVTMPQPFVFVEHGNGL
jgi:hypothetical protein